MYGRKWQTAKLVMNIAITQFKPEEKKSAWIAPSFDMCEPNYSLCLEAALTFLS